MVNKVCDFKIAFSFAGEYREQYIRPISNKLLKLGFNKQDIFFDEWHNELINGPKADDTLREIYRRSLLNVVLLSKEYIDKNWTNNVEWETIREYINKGECQRIFLIGISLEPRLLNEFSGLSVYKSIFYEISNENIDTIAQVIVKKYKLLVSDGLIVECRPKNTIVVSFDIPTVEQFYDMEPFFQNYVLSRIISLGTGNMVDHNETMEEILHWLSLIDKKKVDPDIAKKVDDADILIGWDKCQYLLDEQRNH